VDEDDPVYVELPPEIDAPPGMCALLKRHMYRTRRAAEGWQSEYSGSLSSGLCRARRRHVCLLTLSAR
jgi:hypothetical protein